uniref:Dinitrogenase iron-molybdenum cofactor biosynthesis protein n=1 Tax=Methanococcus maripaludis (strain C6 / ATCC BAA-1332) TaxID=444158 RepID=A9A6I3_METM6
MKLCITSTGNTLESTFEQRFGRSPYFIIYDTDSKEFSVIENKNGESAHGAGIGSAQLVISHNIDAVISGNMGPNAKQVLDGENIKTYKGTGSTVFENIQLFEKNELSEITKPGQAHQGM